MTSVPIFIQKGELSSFKQEHLSIFKCELTDQQDMRIAGKVLPQYNKVEATKIESVHDFENVENYLIDHYYKDKQKKEKDGTWDKQEGLEEVNYSFISFFPIILGQKLPESGE